jgi:hypothetical protein
MTEAVSPEEDLSKGQESWESASSLFGISIILIVSPKAWGEQAF